MKPLRPGTTKTDQVEAMIRAAIAGGMAVGRVTIRPKEIVLEVVGESPEPMDAADAWLRGKHAGKAGGHQ